MTKPIGVIGYGPTGEPLGNAYGAILVFKDLEHAKSFGACRVTRLHRADKSRQKTVKK